MKLAKPTYLSETIFLKLKAYKTMLRTTCTNCKGTGVISFDEENKIVNRCKECTGKFENIRKYLEVNISPRHVEFTLDLVRENFDQKCFDAFKVLTENAIQILSASHIFISQKSESTSFGVTTMGSILMKSLVDKGFDCCVVSAQEISDCFFNFGDDKDRNERLTKLLDYYEGVHILMITDFSDQFKNGNNSSFRGEKFMDFLLKRKINNRHVIFCSNLHWKTFSIMYDKIRLSEHINDNALKFELMTNMTKKKVAIIDSLRNVPGVDALSSYVNSPTTNHQPPKTPQIPQEPTPIKIQEDIKAGIRRTANAKRKPKED